MIQYKTDIGFDTTLFDLEYTDIDNTVAKGLVARACRNTAGAPAATAGYFMVGAVVTNAVTGIQYKNTGTTASPVWTVSTGVAGIVFAGTASGETTATRAYTITGLLATDIVSAVIRASTNAASIQKATASTDTLTVLFSTDPGADTTVDYIIAR